MKFLHGEPATWIQCTKVVPKKNAAGVSVQMTFALLLDKYNTEKMPSYICGAYESMRNADSGVFLEKIDRYVGSQNLRFYAIPDDDQVRMEIEEVDLVDLRLERFGKKVHLFFSFSQDMGEELWAWAGHVFGHELAVRFEECQGELELKAKGAKG